MSLGGTLRRLRARTGLNQEQVAGRAGISASLLARAETGKRSIGIDNIERLADALEATRQERVLLRRARAEASDRLATPRRPAVRQSGDNTLETLRDEVRRLAEIVDRLVTQADPPSTDGPPSSTEVR